MKRLCLLFLLFLSVRSMCQTIPYATQQPKWVFPVYAEDATGKKDTIYLAYQPGAINSPDSDPSYGEIWHPGVSDFSLSTYYWILPTDSCVKADVKDTNSGYWLFYTLTLSNAVMPVTFTWDISLLRSDSIPFPNQNPLPKSQLRIQRPSGSWYVNNPTGSICGGFSPDIIVSDTIDTNLCYCYIKEDTMKLYYPFNPGPGPIASFDLFFIFEPWVGHEPGVGIEENNLKQLIKIYPNPAIDKVQVSGLKKNDRYEANIHDAYMNLLMRITDFYNESSIDLSRLASGFYFITLQNKNSNEKVVVKIIKL